MFEARRPVGYRNVSCNLIRVVEDWSKKTEEHESKYNYEPSESEAILAKDKQCCRPQRGTPDAAIVPSDVSLRDAHCSLPAWPLIADHWYRTLGSATP